MLEKLGYEHVSPRYNEKRTDLIQTLDLHSKEKLVNFTQGIQSSSPIDSFVRVLPAPMPGYPFDEVMASGSFTQGSTIELSADAPVKEPYKKLRHQGMILGSNNEKMSKSRGNVINPDDVVNTYGADALRVYEMFMGPIEASKPWNENGLDAAKKFLERFYRIFEENKVVKEPTPALEKIFNQTVKKVTEDYESVNINTAISQMMIFINAIYKEGKIEESYARALVQLLNPLAPHITEEVWHEFFKEEESIAFSKWPSYDETKIVDCEFTMVVQINGKVRGKILVSSTTTEDEMLEIAKSIDNVKSYLEGKEIIKVITIPKKLINIVIK